MGGGHVWVGMIRPRTATLQRVLGDPPTDVAEAEDEQAGDGVSVHEFVEVGIEFSPHGGHVSQQRLEGVGHFYYRFNYHLFI